MSGINWCAVCNKAVDTLTGRFDPRTLSMTYVATCHGETVTIVQANAELDNPNRATRRPAFVVLS